MCPEAGPGRLFLFSAISIDQRQSPRRGSQYFAPMKSIPRGLLVAAVLASAPVAQAQSNDRSGKQVVDAVCASCHARGVKGAPKIGDRKAWGKRAEQGLSSLTEHAVKGIREM